MGTVGDRQQATLRLGGFSCSPTCPWTSCTPTARRAPSHGFDAFWRRTLDEAGAHDLDARFTEVDAGLTLLHTYDVTFSGFGGHRIRGWFLFPRAADGPLPCIVQYLGYGGGRGMVHDWLLWPSAGYATLVMDTRGQSGPNRPGDTPDPVGSGNPGVPGKMTQGLLDPDDYYYRRLFTDAVRAVEVARGHQAVDMRPDRGHAAAARAVPRPWR